MHPMEFYDCAKIQNSIPTFLQIGYSTSDNEPDRIENATHTTFPKKSGY
jgi:hypothetical protein